MARKKKILFCEYYDEWIETYKVDAVADVTLKKYYLTLKHLKGICPNLYVSDLDRRTYQKIINEYAKTHEKQTTIDFHHQVKACIQDLFHDRLIEIDPTYKCTLKGRPPIQNKRKKFLQKDELAKLIRSLDLSEVNKDWFLLIVAKTGLRYAEALALTPADFDWTNNLLTVNKTWDYKNNSGFSKTKTTSSMRVIAIDWQIVGQFQPLIANLPIDEPIFIEKLGANSLKEGGTMAVVLPHGVLFRGAVEGTIRQKLIEKNYLDAVIGLPANLFYGTSIPTAVLVFKKGRESTDVLFIDASSDFEKGKNQNTLSKENIEKILTTYNERRDVDKYAHAATAEEIKENDFNLNIPRYVDTFEEEELIDLVAVSENIMKINAEIEQAETGLASMLNELVASDQESQAGLDAVKRLFNKQEG